MAGPFHAGEIAAQERAGLRALAEKVGRKIYRNHMPDQHRRFFEDLPFLIRGGLDAAGRPWASALFGPPGFVRSPDPRTLIVSARPVFGDPLGAPETGAPVGLLGIQPWTRRRNRMNGRVSEAGEDGFAVTVDQSFGNCPQYIQARRPRFIADPAGLAAPRPIRREKALLSPASAALVRRADTVYLATASAAPSNAAGDPTQGVDASHRGGRSGFVLVEEEHGRSVLTAPDFSGNAVFNSLGNIQANPRAGLLILDYETGALLSLTGAAEILWDEHAAARFPGAERFLRLSVEAAVVIERGVPFAWTEAEPASQLQRTGTWR